MVAVIDYDAGNIKSVEKAVIALGGDVRVTRMSFCRGEEPLEMRWRSFTDMDWWM